MLTRCLGGKRSGRVRPSPGRSSHVSAYPDAASWATPSTTSVAGSVTQNPSYCHALVKSALRLYAVLEHLVGYLPVTQYIVMLSVSKEVGVLARRMLRIRLTRAGLRDDTTALWIFRPNYLVGASAHAYIDLSMRRTHAHLTKGLRSSAVHPFQCDPGTRETRLDLSPNFTAEAVFEIRAQHASYYLNRSEYMNPILSKHGEGAYA